MTQQHNVELNKRIASCGQVQQVIELTSKHLQALNIVNCVTALQRIAKLDDGESASSNSVAQLAHRTTEWMSIQGGGNCQTRHIGGVLWAFAKLGLSPTETVRCTISRGIAMQPGWFKPQEVSMAVWGIGKLVDSLPEDVAASARDFVLRLMPTALSRSSSFDSQGLANVCTGLAAVLSPPAADNTRVPANLLRSLRTRLGSFTAQELANTLSAVVKLGVRLDSCEGLAAEAGDACRARLEEFTPQNLANVAHAAAKMQDAAASRSDSARVDFWQLLAPSVAARCGELNAQELSMCAWAAAHTLCCSTVPPEQVEELAGALAKAVRHAAELQPQQVATLALALVKLGVRHRRTLRALARQARERIGACNAQDLDNLASAYARLGRWQAPRLVEAIVGRGVALLDGGHRFPSRNLCNLLCAVAKLAQGCERLSMAAVGPLGERAGEEIEARVSELGIKDLSNAAWGLASMGSARKECMARIAAAAAGKMGQFDAQECSRLLYAMGRAGVRSRALEAAALEARELQLEFAGAAASVTLRCFLGGASGKFWEREASGAIKGNGGALFEDAHVLAEWLAAHPSPAAAAVDAPAVPRELLAKQAEDGEGWGGLVAVELGAGLGLCSIVAGRLGMRVVATDGDEEVLALLRENVQRNCGGGRGRPSARVSVCELKWGCEAPLRRLGLNRRPDLLMATGCVYASSEQVWAALADTIAELAGPETMVVLAHGNGAAPGVHQLQGSFYGMARARGFEVSRVTMQRSQSETGEQQLHCMVWGGGTHAVVERQSEGERSQTERACDARVKRKRKRSEA